MADIKMPDDDFFDRTSGVGAIAGKYLDYLSTVKAQNDMIFSGFMAQSAHVLSKSKAPLFGKFVPSDVKVIHRLTGSRPLAFLTKFQRFSVYDYESYEAFASEVLSLTRNVLYFDGTNLEFVSIPIKVEPVTKDNVFIRVKAIPEVLANGYILFNVGRELRAYQVSKQDVIRRKICISKQVAPEDIFDNYPAIAEFYSDDQQARPNGGNTSPKIKPGPIKVLGDISDFDAELLIQEQIEALSET